MRFSRSAVNVAVFAALVACAFALGALRARAVGHASTSAVAIVEGNAITGDEVEIRLAEILPAASYHGNVDAARLLALRRAALDELVLDELIYREAVAHGQTASPAQIGAELALVKSRFESPEQFAAALAENDLTEHELRSRLAKTVTVREARTAHARQVITGSDIEAYYRDNAAKFQRPEQVHLLEILVRADPSDPASARKAERKAHRLLGRVDAGEDFGEVARAYSEDEYRVKNGDMGLVHRGRLDQAFDAAVFQAPVGRLAVARSLYGYQVFKVLERRPPVQLSLDEARPIIAESLERQRREERLRTWHARLLAAARVEIRDPSLRAASAADLSAPLAIASRLRAAPRSERQ
jgi:peptidyl-prolyl cis-trans isomerase C